MASNATTTEPAAAETTRRTTPCTCRRRSDESLINFLPAHGFVAAGCLQKPWRRKKVTRQIVPPPNNPTIHKSNSPSALGRGRHGFFRIVTGKNGFSRIGADYKFSAQCAQTRSNLFEPPSRHTIGDSLSLFPIRGVNSFTNFYSLCSRLPVREQSKFTLDN
jgi:hypothetical protein